MTNLQELHKEASNLISDILDLKLGVGDIVEYDTENGLTERVVMHTGTHIALLIDGTFRKLKDLKLKQRNITAEDVLKAFQIVRKFHTTLELSNKGYLTYWESTTDITKQEDWILGKSLFDQKNKTVKFIIKVLGALK